jgi:hypothetical protein
MLKMRVTTELEMGHVKLAQRGGGETNMEMAVAGEAFHFQGRPDCAA